jgi:hypothetical protein
VGDASTPADGSYPRCPLCGDDLAKGHVAESDEINKAGLRRIIVGESA